MRVSFAPEAVNDLEAAIAYLVELNPAAASRLAERVFRIVERLAEGVFEGPEQTLRSGQRVRSWPVPPLRVYYQRSTDELRVLRVHDQRRAPIARP